MSETILKIEGMKCMNCKSAVERVLKAVPGVSSVAVDLDSRKAAIAGSASGVDLIKAVDDAGFKVVDVL